jgi:hypothetical protein
MGREIDGGELTHGDSRPRGQLVHRVAQNSDDDGESDLPMVERHQDLVVYPGKSHHGPDSRQEVAHSQLSASRRNATTSPTPEDTAVLAASSFLE